MTTWTTLIICVTLVLLAVLALCAWLPYLKWGCDVLRTRGSEGLSAFTKFVRAWPHPMSWVGRSASKVLPMRKITERDGQDHPETDDSTEEVA